MGFHDRRSQPVFIYFRFVILFGGFRWNRGRLEGGLVDLAFRQTNEESAGERWIDFDVADQRVDEEIIFVVHHFDSSGELHTSHGGVVIDHIVVA